MKINRNIPGWNGKEILEVIANFASKVPENGNILELGALFGRSTYALGHNKPESVSLHVIEIWPNIMLANHQTVNFHDGTCGEEEKKMIADKIKKDPDRLESDDFFELWKMWTDGISNLHSYKAFTSLPNMNFPMFDFIFHDAGHSYHDVYTDLNHWLPKLKDDGVIIIDDYDRVQFSDLCRAVDQFIEEEKLKFEMVTPRNILLKR